MSIPMSDVHNSYRLFERQRQVDPEDAELAFQLQNVAPVDGELLEKMVYKYSASLYKWVGVILFYRKMVPPSHEEIFNTLRSIFGRSIAHQDQFYGNASVADWLFDLGLMVVGEDRPWSWLAGVRKIITCREHDRISHGPVPELMKLIDGLPVKLRWPLILRYLFDLELPDIAVILHIQTSEVHTRLNEARKQLLPGPMTSYFDQQILAYIDGLLDEAPDELNPWLKHLAECDLCQGYAKKINTLEKDLSARIKERWPLPTLNNDSLDGLIESLLSDEQPSKEGWKGILSLRHSMWMVGFVAIFIILAILFIRITPEEGEFSRVKETASPTLPPVIEIQLGAWLPPNPGIIPKPPQYIMPDFTSDGKWAVFAYYQPGFLPTIMLYNRETNSVQVINEGTPGTNFPRAAWDYVPSISADGEWIAFTSVSDEPGMGGSPCKTSDRRSCVDIFLYHRQDGQTKRITQSGSGTGVNGDSFLPTVSADGQWVAFWSEASNLVGDTGANCESEHPTSCLYIYLYSQATGKIEQIPIHTTVSGWLIDADRISLSTDGRFIGFTVTKGQQVQSNQQAVTPSPQVSQNTAETSPVLEILNNSEAIVYDRETGIYEMENQAQDGTPGNGDSFSPMLSADGRYVAFSSASSNLLPMDRGVHVEVFLRDRTSGRIELISHAPDGSPGNGDSSRTIWTGYGGYGMNISSDGRYIIYNSFATNLSPAAPNECYMAGGWSCNLIYLYDRQIGRNELIYYQPTYGFSFFPSIGADGKWATFMQINTDSRYSDVMLYDRQRAWTTNLTKQAEKFALTPWAYVGSAIIPAETSERNALVFSPDGSLLALAANDSYVRLWRVTSGADLYIYQRPMIDLGGGEQTAYTSLAFTPDGTLLAAGSTAGKVLIWKIPEGNLLYTLEVDSGPINDVKISADGDQLIVSGSRGVEIWKIETHQLIKVSSFSYGGSSIYEVATSPVGNLIATVHGDGTVWLQAIPSGVVVGRLGGNRLIASEIVFSMDGRLLATFSREGKINIWQINRLDEQTTSISLLNSFESDYLSGPIAFSPDGRYLATISPSEGVLLWDVYRGHIYAVSPSNPVAGIDGIAFSYLGDKLAATLVNGEITLWGYTRGSSSTYFVHAHLDNYGDSGPTPAATANDILMLREPAGRSLKEHLTLEQTVSQLTFPLLAPAHLPKNIVFKEARVNLDGSAWLEYDAWDRGGILASLYIYEQTIGDSPPPTMTLGASAVIVQIPIASSSEMAEFVRGDWSWSRYYNSQNTHIDAWDWNNLRPTQRLRWTQQGILIALYYQVTSPFERSPNQPVKNEFVPLDNLLTQQEMVQIARGMQSFSELEGLRSGVTAGH